MSHFRSGLAAIRRDLAKAMPGGEEALHKAMAADGHQVSGRPRTISSEVFMAKAMNANRAGRISASEIY